MKILEYYNKNANEYIQSTINLDMENLYTPFFKNLSLDAYILDLGCGSGRDTLAFKSNGYQVDALDYSTELVKKASELTGIKVRYQSFYDLSDVEKYDGIWACASLLHCDRDKLPDVLTRIHQALRINGVCYMSFKNGNTDREKDGRKFTDLNESQVSKLLIQLDHCELLQLWITTDKRKDHDESWLNILFQKTN
ncbi:class I SAM-dependent methyltransferase [Acinetobacter terrestris]|uniref:class I SAM-dependent methyltransferase n=1 Tax=Acinetobacter terrestris TaxID=2529843 RepID=UPI0035256F3D